MKNLTIWLAVSVCHGLFAQTEHSWYVGNTYVNTGERVIATIDAGTIDTYDGAGIVGEIIDCNGNWGYAMPMRANFTLFVKFSSGEAHHIVQDVSTPNIILRLRKISASKFHLTAYCPNTHRAVWVNFRKVVGGTTVAMGDPSILDASGELVISAPEYKSRFNGKVGINSSSPDSELTVKGTIHSQEVKVDLNVPGPDYVFEENYPLRRLDETKAYVAQHKHLPGIPSSAEMQRNGVNLLEMNMKLLEKVEELTLHLIEQERKMELLNREVQQLKTKRD